MDCCGIGGRGHEHGELAERELLAYLTDAERQILDVYDVPVSTAAR